MASPMATVQARVPLKAGHVYVQGSSFEVKGAGEWYVNGVYTRTPQRVNRADVFQKAGSSLVLMRKGDEGWSLVDLRGSTTFKWSLRSVELYHCCRRPPGHTPPPVGWACAEGEGPAPMLMPGKSPLLPFLKPKTPEETEIPMGTSSFWVSSASRRAAQLAQDALEPIRASRPMRGPTGRPAVVANPAKGGGVPDGSRSQPLLQSLKTTGPRSTRAPPGTIVQFLRSFRVVLTRPYVQVPWGYEWNDEFFTQTGGRVIRDIQGQSPLDRWNVWQEVTGRPDLCVQPGDRLMKADGRWAYCEQEVCLNDSGQAPFLESPELATQQERRLVLEFMRPVGRPAPLMRPRLEVWDTQSALVISWDHPAALEPYKQVWGWSVAICDMDHDIWFIVDGATFVARSLTLEGSDVAVAKPELCTIYVSDGLSHARPYAACIAMLTDQGWSAFSELSRSVSIAPSAKVSDAVLGLDPEDDDWKQRPRFACPRKMVPGASVPVTLRPGPRDLLSNERWLRMDVCVEGHDGLVLVPADSSMRLLQVEKIIPGSSADLWNQKQETFELHGYQTSFSVQPGDVINKINGFSGAQAMLYEVRRKPQKLIMTIDRHCGGNTTFEDIPEAKIFELDRLDIDASRDVEEFDWHVLMSQAEGALCAKMVEEDGRQLQKALDIFSEMLAEHTIVMVNQGIVQEADRRILLDDRVEAVLKQHVSEETAMDISLSVEPVRRRNSMEEEMPTTSDEISLIHLRKAMADAAMDEDQLELAIMSFVNSSKVVRQSFAGRELLEKAKGLQELWRWWRASADAQDELGVVLDYMLKKEADYQDDDGEFHDFDIQDPPYDLGPLKLQLEVCEKFKTEMGTLLHEGHVVWDRLRQSNLRFRAEKRIRAAMRDEREDDLSLDEALSAGEACGVNNTVISAGRELATNWRANHYKIALHDELFQAVKALRKHVEKRGKPGAGAPEQQRMRIAIAGSGLPPDNPLVLEAWGLLRQWEQDNVALRAEARLTSAVERVQGGFSSDAPEAGDLLGSAIAEVAQQGVDAQFLDAARKSLAAWQESRLKRARQELELAMRYSDEDYLKESLELSKTAGIDEETIEKATRQLARLRMVDEVHKMLDKAMEESELDPLEKAIQTAHSNFFVEEEMDMLWSGSLQARLRFWAKEIQGAVQVRQAEGLDKVVLGASRLVERSQMALELFRSKTGVNKVPDVAIRTLERDIRGLQLALPGGRDLANIHDATANIERVLGAVERYAAELPEVIAKAEAQVPKGLNPDLVQEAKYCQEEYAETVQELEDAISKATGEELKRALIAARLAGAPMELIDRGFAKLEKKFPELLTYTKTELELLVAKQEADDIQELSAEGRFLRLQDAADAAKLLVPRLEKSILEEVEDISMALAAERSFVMAVKEAKDIIAGLPMSPEDVHIRVLRLGHAIQACQMSAQEEAKKGLPEAYELQGLLEEEAERRQTALDSALALAAERGTPLKDLLISITAARQASVTPDLLEEPYARLRKKKLDFVTSALRNACSNGWYALAYALYHRGLALKAGEERNGGEWRSGAIEAEINRLRTDVTILKGEFLIETSGGAFGTSTWRKNPCYLIRCNAPVRAESKENRQTRKTFSSKSSNTGVRVSIALAEAGDFPATMALHVVKNNKDVHEAGAAHMLLPGFDVVAASHEDDDIPNCEFDLPPSSQPYFIVPSAAKGELGSFWIIINATEAVEVARIPANFREPRQSHQSFKLKWLQERPYNIFMGGGRSKQKAPMLSWYRNPQFRVSMKPKEAPLEQIPPSLRGRTPPPRLSRPETQELTLRPNTAPVTPTSLDRFQKVDKARLRSVFDSCDTQSNGLVNKRELIKAIRRDAKLAEFFGLPMEIRQEDGSRDEMEKLFQAMDSDSDREISWEEFVQFHTSVQKSKEDAVQELETPPPLLVVILTPHVRPKAGPAAIHIIRNTDNGEEDGLVTENPTFHEVLASSAHGREYSTASEVGAVLKLPEDGKDLVVVPSLKSTGHQGRFTISFMSTRELQVERIQ